MGVGTRKFVFDRELDCMVEVTPGSNRPPPEKRLPMEGVMSDIPDYIAVGIKDEAKGPGHFLHITKGRRQHRDELRARQLTEVGNEQTGTPDKPRMAASAPEVREALAMTGYYDGAATIRQLRRQQHR